MFCSYDVGSVEKIILTYQTVRGTRWRSWLRHCAKSRKIAGSIPDGVIGIFHLLSL